MYRFSAFGSASTIRTCLRSTWPSSPTQSVMKGSAVAIVTELPSTPIGRIRNRVAYWLDMTSETRATSTFSGSIWTYSMSSRAASHLPSVSMSSGAPAGVRRRRCASDASAGCSTLEIPS